MSVWFFCPLFDWVIHFSSIELHVLLVYFGDNYLSIVSFVLFSPILKAAFLPYL